METRISEHLWSSGSSPGIGGSGSGGLEEGSLGKVKVWVSGQQAHNHDS